MSETLVYNVPVKLVDRYRGRNLIVRSAAPAEIANSISTELLPLVRFVQLLSMPGDISPLESWAAGVPIDIVLTTPAAGFTQLYNYATLKETHPVRITIPVIEEGFGKAVRLAISLGFSVKLNPGQPDRFLIEELSGVLDLYLHNAKVQQPIEFFQTALRSFYQPQAISMWEINEEDPLQVRYITDDGEETISRRFAGFVPEAELHDFVERFGEQLLAEKGECCSCDFYSRCYGTQNDAKRSLGLDVDELGAFMADLTDVWVERGYSRGIAMDPMAELVKQFMDGSSCLPCIWQSNCADEFISIDARGFVAQCDCWVTSYPEYFFGNIFKEENLGRMLRESRARQDFVKRPVAVIPQDCIECDYLSLCHGGCPVRTYSFRGTMFEKDPYCHTYLAMFRKAEDVARKLSGNRARGLTLGSRTARLSKHDMAEMAGTATPAPLNLVQIQRRSALKASL
jgi:radical SAM protein with 4Fe4S-binding SPASM domain